MPRRSNNIGIKIADPGEDSIIGRLNALISSAQEWNKENVKRLKFRLASFGLKEQSELVASLKGHVKTDKYELDRISFSLVRHGIFYEHGVGRGRPVGSDKARKNANPWINPVLEPGIQELADILANEYGDIVSGSLRFLVPGISDFKIEVKNNG